MKKYLATLFLLLSQFIYARPHLDLEMTSDEYRIHLKNLEQKSHSKKKHDPEIMISLRMGERLSQWMAKINESRPSHRAIRLSSPQTRRSYSINHPHIYSARSIKNQAELILSHLPEAMKSVMISDSELPSSPLISDEIFLKHAQLIDQNYQSAARYKLVDIYRMLYISAASKDVRGYYYLVQNNISSEDLKEIDSINPIRLNHIKEALIKICLNSQNHSFKSCKKRLDSALKENTLSDYYLKFYSGAQKNWDHFFKIPSYAVRKDIQWTHSTMTVPFHTPQIEKFTIYLKDNIEDEFRFKEWSLHLNFGHVPSGPRLIFQPGVVPHVNGLGGNQIIMDSNQPIEEYDSQWVIRHEFGHVLGLPDCYHEFYDTTLEAYVNYQLDTTDLMCSRAGNMNERIYNELSRHYFQGK